MTTRAEATAPVIGAAIAKLTGERRLIPLPEYLELDRGSKALWEFFPILVDPGTNELADDHLRDFGFERGGTNGYSRRAGRSRAGAIPARRRLTSSAGCLRWVR